MVKVLRNILIMAFSLLVFEACDKETSDTTAPEAIVATPVANTTYYRGQTLFLNATFTDDTALKECTAYLTSQTKNSKGWDSPWNPNEHTFALDGTEDAITNQYLFEPTIPMNIMSGDYILVIVTVDQELNFSKVEIPIYIK